MVVHGHSTRPEPEIRSNRIGIDTGAWNTNQLTALVLEADSRRFLRT
jgi:serine/threonine protein phosphatase 1